MNTQKRQDSRGGLAKEYALYFIYFVCVQGNERGRGADDGRGWRLDNNEQEYGRGKSQ